MNSIALTVLSMSLSGSILALILFALSPLLKNRTSKTFQYYIWIPILLRFVLPVGFSVALSTASVEENQPEILALVYSENDDIQSSNSENVVFYSENNDSDITLETTSEGHFSSTENDQILRANITIIITLIWLIGVLASICWHTISYNAFKRRVRDSIVKPHPDDIELFEQHCDDRNVRLVCCGYVDTPMLVGLFDTQVIVPNNAYLKNGMKIEFENILKHELTHNRRHDIAYKWLLIMVQSIHWFNPVVYLVTRKVRQACELSCDEAVIREMPAEQRKRYGNTLLALSSPKRLPASVVATTLCEEKQQLKNRLLSIKEYRKRTKVETILMIMVVLLLTACSSVYADFQPDIRNADSISEEIFDGFRYGDDYYTLGTATETSFLNSQAEICTVLRPTDSGNEYVILPGLNGTWSESLQKLVYADGKKIRICNIDGTKRETVFKVPTGKSAQLRAVMDEYAIVRGVFSLNYGATMGDGAYFVLNLITGESVETEIRSATGISPLAVSGGWFYYGTGALDGTENKIYRCNVETGAVEIVASNVPAYVDQPGTVVGDHLYFHYKYGSLLRVSIRDGLVETLPLEFTEIGASGIAGLISYDDTLFVACICRDSGETTYFRVYSLDLETLDLYEVLCQSVPESFYLSSLRISENILIVSSRNSPLMYGKIGVEG